MVLANQKEGLLIAFSSKLVEDHRVDLLDRLFCLHQQIFVDSYIFSFDLEVENAISQKRELMRRKKITDRSVFGEFFNDGHTF